ncbi:hypothetical protein HU230_0008890 [Bradyrhizobium quebecense]|uniref:HK97 family phage prohead protease n=1 Tax=Bradyrhizobium quebecense TaxID=2748629 RepID=A0A973WUM3_9BRAD|nr:hypothetical protein [Bradyrhizobium quebecense]UGA46133.1 hypothetical protein HU230_0008890 [Bradyrhizobium quebecense]
MTGSVYKKVASQAGTLSGDDLDFLLSSPWDEDSYGDIVGDPDDPEYGWHLESFRTNPAALFAHNNNMPPIGTWRNVSVRNRALRGTLVFAPRGASKFADEISDLTKAGIIKGVSVGFIPKQSRPRVNGRGTHYLEQVLKEASLCGIPALPSALVQAKQMGISTETIKKVFRPMPESVGERIRRARRTVAKAKLLLAKTTSDRSRQSLIRAIEIIEAEGREAMAASCRLPHSSQSATQLAAASKARAIAMLEKVAVRIAMEEAQTASGQVRAYSEEVIASFTNMALRHPDPPSQIVDPTINSWRGQSVPGPTWRGKKI